MANQILDVLAETPKVSIGEFRERARIRRGYAPTLIEMHELGIIAFEWNREFVRDEDTVTLLISLRTTTETAWLTELAKVALNLQTGVMLAITETEKKRLERLQRRRGETL